MLRKNKVFTIILAVSLFLASVEGALASNIISKDMVNAAAEDESSSSMPEYDDLYGLRVEVTQNPSNPYYRSGTPDYSGLELSVFTKRKDGNESEVLSNASLDEVRTMFNAEAMEGPGGGVFVVMVSAYSTALNETVTANAEFYMEVIDSSEVTSIRSEIVNLPNNTVMYADTGLDLSGLMLSVWETTSDGTETEVCTNADLETIRKRYTVDVSYKASEYDGEGICVITIYTSVRGMEVKTSSEFTYTVGGLKPTTETTTEQTTTTETTTSAETTTTYTTTISETETTTGTTETSDFLRGDCNHDGSFNVSDVVLLQKWLLAVPDTHLADWKAADLCEDGRLDVFDLCLMKRELLNHSTEKEYPVENPEVIDEFTPCTATIDDDFMDWKIRVIIKCQYSESERVWTADDFYGVENIKKINQYNQVNPYRQVLEISLKEDSKEAVIQMIHDIEALGIEEIKEVVTIPWSTGDNGAG